MSTTSCDLCIKYNFESNFVPVSELRRSLDGTSEEEAKSKNLEGQFVVAKVSLLLKLGQYKIIWAGTLSPSVDGIKKRGNGETKRRRNSGSRSFR